MGRRKSMKLVVPPRILKQQLLQEKPPHSHHHAPNIPPRVMKLLQQQQQEEQQPPFKRLIPPRLRKQQVMIRSSKLLMMQEPIGMAMPRPHYLFGKHSPVLIPRMHLLVQHYLVPPPFFNFQIHDREPDKKQEHLRGLPLEPDESSAVDYARLTSFLNNKDDGSALTPWNWNPLHGHSTSANKCLQSGTSSYFSFNVREKWAH